MARKRRYDLYEGDGEEIGNPYSPGDDSLDLGGHILPGRQAKGREEELKERQAVYAQAERIARGQDRRYFDIRNDRDGRETSAPLFDDFDTFRPVRDELPPRRPRKRIRHRGAWITLIVFCLVFLAAIAAAALPQMTGLRYRFLPNIIFINGNRIRVDTEQEAAFSANRQRIYTDRIHEGIYIDDIAVGGMTREEARRALARDENAEEDQFDITVTYENRRWHVENSVVPVSRNVNDLIEKAWAVGRGNAQFVRWLDGDGTENSPAREQRTPFQDRVEQAAGKAVAPMYLYSVKTYDHQKLKELVDTIAAQLDRAPVNSRVLAFDPGTKMFSFSEDQAGAHLDTEALYRRLTGMLDRGEKKGDIPLTLEKDLAEVTKTELMNSFGLISTYTTKTTNDKNRNTNIDLSARAINGTTVNPGEVFSFNKATGERTAAKGYKEAAAISGGESRDEIGGGVCQTSSTLFNAAVRADMEIVERAQHAWPSSYIDKGLDATVNWPGLDMQFKNNSDWPVFILMSYADRKVTASIYGMTLGTGISIDMEGELVREIPQPEGQDTILNTDLKPGTEKRIKGRKGYVVDTWKIWRQNGQEIRRELLFTTTYKAYKETLEYNPR